MSRSISSSTRRPKLYIGTACDQCFRTKARCAGERPACTRCQLNGTPCTYSTGRKRKQTSDRELQRDSESFGSCSESSVSSLAHFGSQHGSPAMFSDTFEPEAPFHGAHRDIQGSYALKMGQTHPVDHLGLSGPLIQTDLVIVNDIESWDHANEPAANGHFQLPGSPFVSVDDVHTASLESSKWHSGVGELATAGPEPQFQTLLPQHRRPVKNLGNESTWLSCLASLGNTLARLQTYELGLSVYTAEETLLQLQHSLSVINSCFSNAEDYSSNMGLDRSSPPPPTSQLAPVVAITCSHTVQLVFSCYFKLRHQNRPMPARNSRAISSPILNLGQLEINLDDGHALKLSPKLGSESPSLSTVEPTNAEDLTTEQNGFNNLIDFYITRDMRLCQSIAVRLISWCRRLLCSMQKCSGWAAQQTSETVVAIESIIEPLQACTMLPL